jgi:hypothetical protein
MSTRWPGRRNLGLLLLCAAIWFAFLGQQAHGGRHLSSSASLTGLCICRLYACQESFDERFGLLGLKPDPTRERTGIVGSPCMHLVMDLR